MSIRSRFAALLLCLCVVLCTACAPLSAAPGTTLTPEAIREAGSLVLINHDFLWPEGYEPENMVSLIETRPKGLVGLRDGSLMADAEAFDALVDMLQAAKEAGHTGYIVLSAYRSFEKQAELYEEDVVSFLDRIQGRAAHTAAPGASEHHTGLAFDLGVMKDDSLLSGFGSTAEGQWINEHCHEFGFVQRYAEDKKDITGIIDEPWHYRYVGIEAARAMTEANQCLEEYLEN